MIIFQHLWCPAGAHSCHSIHIGAVAVCMQAFITAPSPVLYHSYFDVRNDSTTESIEYIIYAYIVYIYLFSYFMGAIIDCVCLCVDEGTVLWNIPCLFLCLMPSVTGFIGVFGIHVGT